MNIKQHYIRWLVVFVIVAIEAYSVHAALDGNSCGYRESMLDRLGCTAFLVGLGLIIPPWLIVAPFIFSFFGVVVPLAALWFLSSAVINQSEDRGFDFFIAIFAALVTGVFYWGISLNLLSTFFR